MNPTLIFRKYAAGDRVSWETVNGPRQGTIVAPSAWPGYYDIKTDMNNDITAHATCLRPVETNPKQ